MNPAKGPRKLMTFAQAQKRVGMKGPRGLRLKRLVLKREKEIGKRIAIRGGTRQPTYRITMGALRKHCPELFESRISSREFEKRMKELDELIENRVSAHVTEFIEPRLDELWERDEIVAKRLDALRDRVAAIAKVKRT